MEPDGTEPSPPRRPAHAELALNMSLIYSITRGKLSSLQPVLLQPVFNLSALPASFTSVTTFQLASHHRQRPSRGCAAGRAAACKQTPHEAVELPALKRRPELELLWPGLKFG